MALVADLLRCPVTAHEEEAPLAADPAGRRLECGGGHRFDLARQGYANLLGHAQQANADTADMVAARERFLGAGHYAALTAAVADRLADLPGRAAVLETGAGTAHHLAGVLSGRPAWRGLATDVSVPACRRAARAHPRLGAVVADVWRPWPVRTGALDAVLAVFAPRNAEETARVLAPGGVLVVVTPEPGHLAELRADGALLGIEDSKVERLRAQLAGRFAEEEVVGVHRVLDLDAGATRDLVAMGPNGHHLGAEELTRRWSRPTRTTLQVRVARYCRTG
ncbi:hypothetical protein GC722_14420 [Auraticoccus sp. F435]|uniref:23S rRNA (guanine(745)-N(1))-methyltransferase N-terminal domain-containing protein n=1 Tax=Auraticoccus cholistanensis TaxID=2656650 RepID=A0A6A9V1J1_9ACTN|nr:hypothetical protein [Auraticoccus cholistanensis]